MQRSKEYKQSSCSSTPHRGVRGGDQGWSEGWEATWASGRRGADGQVQVRRRFGCGRVQLRRLTVGGFLESFENPLLGRLFVSSSGAQFKGPRRAAEPSEPLRAGGERGRGGQLQGPQSGTTRPPPSSSSA